MKNKRILTITALFGLAVLLSLFPVANSGVAAGDAPAGYAPDGETVPYSGRLSNDAGQPVPDGGYAFSFALYDAAQDGNLLWSETQTGIDLKGGAFRLLLGSMTPLPQEARRKDGWLAVSVRGPGEIDFTALTPRQQINTAAREAPSSPAAGPSCPHDHLGEDWIGDSTQSGLYITNNRSGYSALSVVNNGTFGTGVMGKSTSENGVGIAAWNSTDTGVALNIVHGAFEVHSAGINPSTPVFIQQASAANNCPAFTNATVINHVLTNDDPKAILIVTLNGGTLGEGVGPSTPYITVQYDANNVCGMGQKWVIFNNLSAMPNGTLFNVMVIKP